MPDAQSEIQFAFEALHETLGEFAQIDADQHGDLIGAFTDRLFGAEQAQVEALLTGPVGRPLIPVTVRGVPALSDCWARVLAAVEAYNLLGTGLRLTPPSTDPAVPQVPHCVDWVVINGQLRLVINYAVGLTFAGRTEPVYRLSAAAGVARQVLAMGHAAISVPIEPAP